jgi:hypothetical protein
MIRPRDQMTRKASWLPLTNSTLNDCKVAAWAVMEKLDCGEVMMQTLCELNLRVRDGIKMWVFVSSSKIVRRLI